MQRKITAFVALHLLSPKSPRWICETSSWRNVYHTWEKNKPLICHCLHDNHFGNFHRASIVAIELCPYQIIYLIVYLFTYLSNLKGTNKIFALICAFCSFRSFPSSFGGEELGVTLIMIIIIIIIIVIIIISYYVRCDWSILPGVFYCMAS